MSRASNHRTRSWVFAQFLACVVVSCLAGASAAQVPSDAERRASERKAVAAERERVDRIAYEKSVIAREKQRYGAAVAAAAKAEQDRLAAEKAAQDKLNAKKAAAAKAEQDRLDAKKAAEAAKKAAEYDFGI